MDTDLVVVGAERPVPPAPAPAPWQDRPGGPKYSGVEVDALLDEMRGDH